MNPWSTNSWDASNMVVEPSEPADTPELSRSLKLLLQMRFFRWLVSNCICCHVVFFSFCYAAAFLSSSECCSDQISEICQSYPSPFWPVRAFVSPGMWQDNADRNLPLQSPQKGFRKEGLIQLLFLHLVFFPRRFQAERL